jgi:hypothetical protein
MSGSDLDQSFPRIIGDQAAHLRRVVIEFVNYYNTARPHQGIDQQIPIPQASPSSGAIQCRNILGGIIHDYYRAPTQLALPST